jgi:hypothetical protein
MHRIFSRSLAWHLHALCGHVHFICQFGIVCSEGLLLRLHALVNVKNRVFMLVYNAWVMRCAALLCCAILKPFKYGCLPRSQQPHHGITQGQQALLGHTVG